MHPWRLIRSDGWQVVFSNTAIVIRKSREIGQCGSQEVEKRKLRLARRHPLPRQQPEALQIPAFEAQIGHSTFQVRQETQVSTDSPRQRSS
ncbi:hypothetical protein ACLKA6_015999 [Drosophila palustris]